MLVSRVLCAVGGFAAASIIGSLGKDGMVHQGAVKATAAFLRAADKVADVTQTISDEAADINAAARRQARIDAAVAARMSALEESIRAEVTAQVDGASDAVQTDSADA